MRFDYTQGRPAKYLVSVYAFNVHDLYFYADYKAAKAGFNELGKTPHDRGTVLSLYDLKNDVRKEFTRC